MSKIVLGVTSGIAAYKMLDLVAILKKANHGITVLMTRSARKIVSPADIKELTGENVFIELFPPNFSKSKILKNRKIDHVEIAKFADIFVVAPATANSIAKMANGIADDFITTTLLATQAPTLICPSMNDLMWYHPATQKNLQIIRSFGYEILEPESGALACGTDGIGRLPKVSVISAKIEEILARKKMLAGKKVLVTGGGTLEPIDEARVITNRSSGLMGKALAESAYRFGSEVTFLHAKNATTSHLPIEQVSFVTSKELTDFLTFRLSDFNIVFHSAAVSDFIVSKVDGKIKSDNPHDLHLETTGKIINEIKKINPKITLVGFKAISFSSYEKVKGSHPEPVEGSKKDKNWIPDQVRNDSLKLFKDAGADFVVVNDISRKDIGFESTDNEVYLVSKDEKIVKIEKAPKSKIASEIIKTIYTIGV